MIEYIYNTEDRFFVTGALLDKLFSNKVGKGAKLKSERGNVGDLVEGTGWVSLTTNGPRGCPPERAESSAR